MGIIFQLLSQNSKTKDKINDEPTYTSNQSNFIPYCSHLLRIKQSPTKCEQLFLTNEYHAFKYASLDLNLQLVQIF